MPPGQRRRRTALDGRAAGGRAGGKATWIGFAMDDDCTEELIAWVTAGGPGVAAPPAALELQFVPPPREAKAARTRR
ncbi:hypothetical protein [Streptomyces boluensis]|uniref:hypothetical protein n=1 Tax=Streptomyces boluensis TaxID=1775135 RepID=UPI00406BBD6D